MKHNRSLVASYLDPMTDRRRTSSGHTKDAGHPTLKMAAHLALVGRGDQTCDTILVTALRNIGRCPGPYGMNWTLRNLPGVVSHMTKPIDQYATTFCSIVTPRPYPLRIQRSTGLPRHSNMAHLTDLSGINHLNQALDSRIVAELIEQATRESALMSQTGQFVCSVCTKAKRLLAENMLSCNEGCAHKVFLFAGRSCNADDVDSIPSGKRHPIIECAQFAAAPSCKRLGPPRSTISHSDDRNAVLRLEGGQMHGRAKPHSNYANPQHLPIHPLSIFNHMHFRQGHDDLRFETLRPQIAQYGFRVVPGKHQYILGLLLEHSFFVDNWNVLAGEKEAQL